MPLHFLQRPNWHPILKGLSNALAVVLFVGLLASSLTLFVLSGGDGAGAPPSFRQGRWLFLPGVIVGTLLVLRELYLGYERRVHPVVLPDGAATDSRGFFLVLRPFDKNFHARRSARHRAPIVDISGGFVRQLVRALVPHGAVLLVGGSKIKGAVMLRPPQHVWKRLVMAAAEDARAVILIPSLSLGVREEIFEICQGPVRHKLVVCVPPDVDPDIAADVWKSIRGSYARIGIQFPAYHAGGFVYRPFDASLRTLGNGEQQPPIDRRDRSLDAELLSLVDRIGERAAPLQSSLPRLLDVMREPPVSDAPEVPFFPPFHQEVLRVACRLAESNEDGSFASAELKEAVMPEDDQAAFWEIVDEFVRHGFMTVSLFRSTLTIKAAGFSYTRAGGS